MGVCGIFIEHLGQANEDAWRDLGTPMLDDHNTQTLIDGCVQATQGHSVDELRERRDRQLLALLKQTERVL